VNTARENTEPGKIPEVQKVLERAVAKVLSEKLHVSAPLAWKEYGLTYEVKDPGSFHEIMKVLKEDPSFAFNMLIDVTCVDWLDAREKRFEVVYQLLSLVHMHRVCIKVSLPESSPKVSSVRDLWEGANFLEREVYDLFGVEFEGHGDLRRILMYDEFVGYPLRKDYPLRGKQPRVKLRVPELRNTSADLSREQLVSLPVRRGRS
jgi:NADH-quinone oxidoreductase subunit C